MLRTKEISDILHKYKNTFDKNTILNIHNETNYYSKHRNNKINFTNNENNYFDFVIFRYFNWIFCRYYSIQWIFFYSFCHTNKQINVFYFIFQVAFALIILFFFFKFIVFVVAAFATYFACDLIHSLNGHRTKCAILFWKCDNIFYYFMTWCKKKRAYFCNDSHAQHRIENVCYVCVCVCVPSLL